ncbi:MAG: hypothetical protein IJ428_01700 [Clostridia bacterium]|nr:hypothetical protein [Clostridia bacterium]
MSERETTKIYPIKADPRTDKYKYTADSPSEPTYEKPPLPIWVLIFELILALLALTTASMLTFSLFTEYTHTYINTVSPTLMDASPAAEPSDMANEADIPAPVYVPIYYDFTLPVPESPAVGYDYFNDTVFIGDSRTKGLIMYTELTPYDFSSVGTNVGTVQTKAFIRMEDENGELQNYTLFEALERESGNYKTIYIALGLNELGWKLDKFDITFRELIANIRKITDVPIYLQLIMPVTQKASETTQFGITNDKAVVFNAYLRNAAAELELFCLDPTGMFSLEDGTLDPAHASDGIHLQISSYKQLADFYRTHIVDTEAYDNTRTIVPEESEGTEYYTEPAADGNVVFTP